jgi:hypothetical protein
LIAVVLFSRYLRHFRHARKETRLPLGTVPLMVIGALARAAAEGLGYLGWSPADLDRRIDHLEIHKAEYVPGWNR